MAKSIYRITLDDGTERDVIFYGSYEDGMEIVSDLDTGEGYLVTPEELVSAIPIF